MDWQDVCEHPSLQNLPFKIELNEDGRILMTPVKVYHAAYQGKIGIALDELLKNKGYILMECAVKTSKGIKVADVAWSSKKRFRRIKDESACSVAPEICVEIVSLSNTAQEISEKRALYFESGAKEVWICKQNGEMSFYDATGQLQRSGLTPKFPSKIKF